MPKEISSRKVEDLIFVSIDKGMSWFMPSYFADCVGHDMDRMTWMADGSSERIGVQVRKVALKKGILKK